ncbi:MAG: DUF362 domain-containing protein, partial [Bryobacteraceae bacterium]
MDLDPSQPGRRATLLQLLRAGGLGAAAAGAGLWLSSRSRRPEEAAMAMAPRNLAVAADPQWPAMVVAQGADPAALVRSALDRMGGMRRFVSRDDVVVIKPNMAWDRTPEQAANTNPDVVAALVRLCLEAGAGKAIVTDVSIHDARSVFDRSGIAAAARSAGAELVLPEARLFRDVDLRGEVLGVWPVLEPFLTADKVINVPIAKQHSLTGATLGMKNWYGILGGQRMRLHQRIHESLADLLAFLRPTLTVLDAYRVLMRNGPTGGSLDDVALKQTVIASTDPVAVDAYAAQAFWGLDERTLVHLRLAAERKLGTTRYDSLRVDS